MKKNFGWGRRKKKKAVRVKLGFFFVMSVFIFLLVFSLVRFDQNVMPVVLSAYDLEAKNEINNTINHAVTKIIEENKLTTNDFFKKNTDAAGKIQFLSINTLLVNKVCNQAAVEISNALGALDDETIEIPAGTLSGVAFLANRGPKLAVSVKPHGNAIVDYQSKFVTSGINQTNFQIWLHVRSSIHVLLPLQQNEIIVTRDIPLVNTFFSGEVPAAYLNMEQSGQIVD